jgi:hypothetical protein
MPDSETKEENFAAIQIHKNLKKIEIEEKQKNDV